MSRTGAARLAAHAALRAGAGLVTLASPPDALAVNAAHLSEIMLARLEGGEGLAKLLGDRRIRAVALGPALGSGQTSRDMALAALASDCGVVLDADALTSFADGSRELFSAIGARSAPVVMTPHEGEFARLFETRPEGASKLDAAREAAKVSGAVVVLKGSDTVIAAPDGRAAINADAPPWLATAGSGDVLTGLICGLLAQGLAGFEAACAGTWIHGRAAGELGPGMLAGEIAEAVPGVLGALYLA
jgi:hydroxyethylthiazole kinase-like uncharacterized protein yjeF